MTIPQLTLTVSEITKQIKEALEEGFESISVIGEISNFKAHNSGHWYFNLKDSGAVICCTMWKGFNNYVFFTPQDGMKVILNGKITVYPPRGTYQIDVRSMKPAGVGELQAAFDRLKRKLSEEGLFDQEHKKNIPLLPKKIGIITASDGAAVKDMISVARRRYPLAELIIAACKVQGTGAAEDIAGNLKLLNSRKGIDVIILARGGGSIEDLWAFNEEVVARAIFESKIPVISGVGHEIDFTIADFVADLRAPTPSVAMELATPSKEDFFAFISDFSYNSTQNLKELCSRYRARLAASERSYGFRVPKDIVKKNWQLFDSLLYRLQNNIENQFIQSKNKLSLLSKSIESHDVQKMLRKGFVLVKQNKNYIARAAKLQLNESFSIKFFDAEIEINKN